MHTGHTQTTLPQATSMASTSSNTYGTIGGGWIILKHALIHSTIFQILKSFVLCTQTWRKNFLVENFFWFWTQSGHLQGTLTSGPKMLRCHWSPKIVLFILIPSPGCNQNLSHMGIWLISASSCCTNSRSLIMKIAIRRSWTWLESSPSVESFRMHSCQRITNFCWGWQGHLSAWLQTRCASICFVSSMHVIWDCPLLLWSNKTNYSCLYQTCNGLQVPKWYCHP